MANAYPSTGRPVRRRRSRTLEPEAGRRLVEVWRTSARATELLVGKLPKEIWTLPIPGAPRRTVRAIAAHLHNARGMWLKMLGGGTKGHGVAIPRSVDARRVTREEHEIELTPTEFSLLELLMRYAGQVVTRRMLCEHLWETDWEGATNVIEVHINRLRGKLDKGFDESVIQTVRGRGYALRAT